MLTTETALRKDRNAAPATMQHRHFATIAAIVRDLHQSGTMSLSDAGHVADHFARSLNATNANFDHARFLRACGV